MALNSARKHKSKGMTLGSKKFLIFIIVLLILICVFFINLFRGNSPADYDKKTVRTSLAAISTFDYSKVTTVEKEIKKLEITEAQSTFDVTKVLSKEQYRKILKTSVIIGDSVTEGLTDYGWLGSEQVFCKIGASIINSDDLFTSAAKVYPSYAFMAFGMNDIGNYNGNPDGFIEKYKKLIKEFKKISPDTKILINGITPPSQNAIEANSILKNYKKFNNAIKQMCKELDLTYMDNTFILEEHPDFYEGDGIHVSTNYYPYWMNNMILKAGL